MGNTGLQDLSGILRFVEECGGFFANSKCKIGCSPVGGLGMFALRNLNEGETLLQLPKSAVFSSSNSSIANLLVDSELDGMLALCIAFMYETTVFRKKSHWWPYLKSIKIEQDGSLYVPPNCWSLEERNILKGTALDTLYGGLEMESEIKQGFVIALKAAYKWNRELGLSIPWRYLYTLKRFVAVMYAISSRVFEIDNYHESGLVPIADLFNHHASTPDVRFVSLYEVCNKCAEPGICKHLMAEATEDLQEPNKSSACGNEGLISMQLIRELESTNEEDTSNYHFEGGLIEGVQPDECVDIVLSRSVQKGQEIFNSYGEYSNALLLARYGFCVEGNPFDLVYLGRDLLKLLKDKKLALRARWWKNHGYSLYNHWHVISKRERDAEGGEESYWSTSICIDVDGRPLPPMRALLNLLASKDKDWYKLRSIDQDIESHGHRIGQLDRPLSAGAKKILAKLLKLATGRKKQIPKNCSSASRIMLKSEQKILKKATNNMRS